MIVKRHSWHVHTDEGMKAVWAPTASAARKRVKDKGLKVKGVKKGPIRYGVRVSRDGERHWLGTFDRLGEAREVERNFLSTRRDPLRGPTCGEFARLWLAQGCPRTSGRKIKSETLHEYEYRSRPFIAEFGSVPMGSVSREAAFTYALEHRHHVDFARALFSHARDIDMVDYNPFAQLGLHKGKGRKHNVPLTEAQLYELADAVYLVDKRRDEWAPYAPQFRAFILFQAFTGLRPGETFELRWSDIEGDRIHVRRRLGKYGTVDLPKSNVERHCLLPPPAMDALRTFPRGLDLVFRGVRGQRLARGCAFRYFKAVREAYGRPDLDLYDLRHFAAHQLYVRMGLPARVVAVQLGHADGGRLVAELYGHGDTDAMEQLEGAWANVG